MSGFTLLTQTNPSQGHFKNLSVAMFKHENDLFQAAEVEYERNKLINKL